MAWIETVPPEQAQGELRELYDRIAGARGGVAQVHQIMFQASPLSRVQREQLAVAASQRSGRVDARRAERARYSHAVLTVAYFNYVNRLVLALGAAVEPGFQRTCRPELAG